MAERLDRKLGKAVELLDRLARSEDHRDLLGQEAVGDERKHARGRTIEPLRVVDDTEERLLAGRFRQEAEDGEADEKEIRMTSRAQPERDLHGITLGIRQSLDEVEARRAQLLQRSERKLDLPFHPSCAGDTETCSRLERRIEQGRLADARLAVHHQYAAVAVARRFQDPVEHRTLAPTPEQPRRR